MCSGCSRVWTILHVLWSAIYVSCGAAQLVSAIFFFISVPQLHLTCNLWAGIWNILFGIGGGMVACFGQLSSRRQEMLLYITISILTVNTVNAVLNEWGLYVANTPKIFQDHPYHTLITYACYATRISAAAAILASFLDSQLAFCSMQTSTVRDNKKLRRSHEQVSDIEYIIPRSKSTTKPQTTVVNAYSQSWVFEADNASCSNNAESPYLKVSQEATTPKVRKKSNTALENGGVGDTAHLIDNPVVHVEEASDDSASNSDRKLCYMKSFSRSTSPVVLSASSSQISLNLNSTSNPPIYECLEKLTEPTIYRSRLSSALSNREEDEPEYQSPQQAIYRRIECVSPHAEKVQYASLMKELQKAIVNKKEPNLTSPPSNSDSIASNQTHSKSSSRHDSSKSDAKNSDAEFSKELEAALQLIQDLESPNTVDTPSDLKLPFEGKDSRPLQVWRNSDASESEKTLSAVGSLGEITPSPLTECQPEFNTFKPPAMGKAIPVVVQYCDSQSTSGYSSPTHKSNNHTPNWSTASSISGSNHDIGKSLSYIIHNTQNAAVISLYPQDTLQHKNKNVTLVTISGKKSGANGDLVDGCGDGSGRRHDGIPLKVLPLNGSKSQILGNSQHFDNSLPLDNSQPLDKPKSLYITSKPLYTTKPFDVSKPLNNSNIPKSLQVLKPLHNSTAITDLDENEDDEVFEEDEGISSSLTEVFTSSGEVITSSTNDLDSSDEVVPNYLATNTDSLKANSGRKSSVGSGSVWNVKSLLRKKKHLPKLCPELEGAIVKSESLAYLSELELLARHQRNKDIHRQIEQRVLQQLGTPRSESNC